MKVFLFLLFSSLILFSCSSASSKQQQTNYYSCGKDVKDFYPVYKTCWEYGLEKNNCEKVADKSKLLNLIKKDTNPVVSLGKLTSCYLICNEALKKKTPTLSYEEFVKKCPAKMMVKDTHIYVAPLSE